MRLRERERQIASAVVAVAVAVAAVVVVVVVIDGVSVNGCVASASAPEVHVLPGQGRQCRASRGGGVFPRGRRRRRSDPMVVMTTHGCRTNDPRGDETTLSFLSCVESIVPFYHRLTHLSQLCLCKSHTCLCKSHTCLCKSHTCSHLLNLAKLHKKCEQVYTNSCL
jgi:hypothetical protein